MGGFILILVLRLGDGKIPLISFWNTFLLTTERKNTHDRRRERGRRGRNTHKNTKRGNYYMECDDVLG